MVTKFERKEGKWKEFDDYKRWRSEIWKITLHNDGTMTCTCHIFLKEGVCHHSLGMEIRQKRVTVPPAAKNIPLGEKRKRGRPSLAKKA